MTCCGLKEVSDIPNLKSDKWNGNNDLILFGGIIDHPNMIICLL